MRRFVWFMIPFALVAASDKPPAAKGPKKPATTAAANSGSISIPPDAVEIGPQVYRYKDAKGKSWIYRKTPFGISKVEEINAGLVPAQIQSAPAPPPANSKIKVSAIDKGDSVRFEQLTPMGPRVWERKKSDLTPEERAWLEQNKNGTATDSTKPEK